MIKKKDKTRDDVFRFAVLTRDVKSRKKGTLGRIDCKIDDYYYVYFSGPNRVTAMTVPEDALIEIIGSIPVNVEQKCLCAKPDPVYTESDIAGLVEEFKHTAESIPNIEDVEVKVSYTKTEKVKVVVSSADEKPLCVVLLATDPQGQVLAVSRKNKPTEFGLPGGKVEKGEDPVDAIRREVLEETGLTCDWLERVFSKIDEQGNTVIAFTGKVSGTAHTEESIIIEWVSKEILLKGPFKQYNKALFEWCL